jgi:hypothetical protein
MKQFDQSRDYNYGCGRFVTAIGAKADAPRGQFQAVSEKEGLLDALHPVLGFDLYKSSCD